VRNFALGKVKGELVTYLDGDDAYFRDKLQKEVELYSQTPEPKIIYSNYAIIDEKGRELRVWNERKSEELPSGDIFLDVFLRRFPRKALYRNELVGIECYRKIKGYDTNLELYEDWDSRIRMTKYYTAKYCDHVLSKYRKHDKGISTKQMELHMKYRRYIYQKNMKLTRNCFELLRVMHMYHRGLLKYNYRKWKGRGFARND
jgi:hypothetical protein